MTRASVSANIEHVSDSDDCSWWRPGELQMQSSFWAFVPPAIDESFKGLRRHELDDEAWVDHRPGWLAGDQVVFDRLIFGLRWLERTGQLQHGQLMREPRLTSSWQSNDGPEPLPVLAAMRRALRARYAKAFESIGFNLYRRGRDSLGWHGDRRREAPADAVVAIVSVGAPRPFQLRPAGGRTAVSFDLGDGDLFVMGGACQRDWEHRVPRRRHAEPRISITFRHRTPIDDCVAWV